MTFKNNRVTLLCCFKLCASFRSHEWIQAGVTVRKRPVWVKIDDCLAVWPWNLTDDLEKQKETSPKPYQALCIISSLYVNSNLSYSPETAKLGFDFCDLDLGPLTSTFCMDITSVIGNNSWKFHDDTMTGTLWKRCNRRTDGLTDRRTDRISVLGAAWSQLKALWGVFQSVHQLWNGRSNNPALRTDIQDMQCMYFKICRHTQKVLPYNKVFCINMNFQNTQETCT